MLRNSDTYLLIIPTPTPAPTPDSCTNPAVESRFAKAAFEYIIMPSEIFAPRASTIPQENAAAEYLESHFSALSCYADIYCGEILVRPGGNLVWFRSRGLR